VTALAHRSVEISRRRVSSGARRTVLDLPRGKETVGAVKRSAVLFCGFVSLLGASGCGEPPVSLGTFPASPEVVPFAGRSGESVLLRHETGAGHSVVVDPAGIRGPLLWDGSWEIVDGSGTVAVFDVGPTVDRFESCWPEEQTKTVEPPVVACLQSVALRRASDPYADVHAEFTAALAVLEERFGEGPGDWYCFLGGEHVAAAAVLSGQDHVGMLERFDSHCSFSLIHGVYMARTYLEPDPEKVCDYRPSYRLAEVDHVSQCWNGVGMGLARQHRFDVVPAHAACLGAPEPGAVKNCYEGMLNYFYNYKFRSPGGGWGPPKVDSAWCSSTGPELEASPDFYDVCYRVAIRDLVVAAADPMGPAEGFATSCIGLPMSQAEGCMVAAGHLAARLVIDFRRPIEIVPSAVEVCRVGEGFSEPCLFRLFSGVVVTGQSPFGFPPGALLPLVPSAHRSAVAEHLDRWLASVDGVAG